jgi:hypothetical protein
VRLVRYGRHPYTHTGDAPPGIALWVYSAAAGDSSMGVRDRRQGTMNSLRDRKREAVLGMQEGKV